MYKINQIGQKTLYTFIFFTFILVIYPIGNIQAKLVIVNPADIAIDTTITRDDVNYNLPTKVVIAPIYPYSSDVSMDSRDLFRGVYYYTVDKLGFNDIPFHYVVSEDGEVFKGNTGGDERRIKVEGIGDDIVLIGYLTDSFSSTFSKKGVNALSDLITQVANQNAIKPEKISVSGVRFIRNQSTKSVSIEAKDVFGRWNTDLDQIKANVSANYSPASKTYKIRVEEVKSTADSVKPGESVDVTIKISNLEQSGIYGGSDSQLVLTRVGANFSSFYLNGEWLSQTQIGIMDDEEILLPFKEATFTFKVKAPLYVGEHKEEFEIKTLNGTSVQADNINISLNMSTPDKPIIEIRDTETGVLNVRTEPSSVASILTQVIPGERFFQMEDAGNGFIKIDLDDGTSGWVLSTYINYISQ